MSDFIDEVKQASAQISRMKHIDGKAVAQNYIFPLLKKLAEQIEEQDASIDELYDAVNYDSDYVTMQTAQEAIEKLASFIDRLMVSTGYFTKNGQTLVPTDKLSEDVRGEYEEVAQLAATAIVKITESLASADDEDEDEDDEEDEDEEDEEKISPEVLEATAPVKNGTDEISKGGNHA